MPTANIYPAWSNATHCLALFFSCKFIIPFKKKKKKKKKKKIKKKKKKKKKKKSKI